MRLPWIVALASGCGFAPTPAASDAPGVAVDAPSADAPGSAAPVDASVAADATTPARVCPQGSGWFQIADSTSWYFASPDAHGWVDSETRCEALQLSGGAPIHLAVADTPTELVELALHDQVTTYWIGMFQPANQSAPDVGWLWITGSAGITGQWATGEPNDDGGFLSRPYFENDDEDFAELYGASSKLNDSPEGTSNRYLCECDGVAVPAATRSQIP